MAEIENVGPAFPKGSFVLVIEGTRVYPEPFKSRAQALQAARRLAKEGKCLLAKTMVIEIP